jgi:hypothetical protein
MRLQFIFTFFAFTVFSQFCEQCEAESVKMLTNLMMHGFHYEFLKSAPILAAFCVHNKFTQEHDVQLYVIHLVKGSDQ